MEAKRSKRPVALCESRDKQKERVARMREAATLSELPPTNVLRIAARDLTRIGSAAHCRDVNDPAALDDKAVFLANNNFQWYTTFKLSPIAFDPAAQYTLRIRLRAAETGKPGEIVQIGVYDYAAKKSAGVLSLKNGKLHKGYAWYDVLTWHPKPVQEIYIAPGWFDRNKQSESSAHEGIWIDAIEFVTKTNCVCGGGNVNPRSNRRNQEHNVSFASSDHNGLW